jgi:hypothetical protein
LHRLSLRFPLYLFTVWHAYCLVTPQRIKMQLTDLEKSVFCAIALTIYCNASESKKPGGGEDRAI